MPTYATQAECQLYTEGLVVTDAAQFGRIIDRAERDIDQLLTVPGDSATTGPKLSAADLAAMTPRDRERIKFATCAQVEYRVAMGEKFFSTHQHKSARGPDFSVEGMLPYIGPKVEGELESFAFVPVGTGYVGVPWT